MSGLLDVLLPPACAACAQVLDHPAPFCAECARLLERTPKAHCRVCSEPGTPHCERCRQKPRAFGRAFAPFAHEGPIARAIHRFKYEDHPELAPTLGRLLARESVEFLATAPSTICALPLHRSRFLSRRYDQAMLLAHELAHLTGRQMLVDALGRTRATLRQVGLSDEAREANVAGAFRATPAARGMRLLLVDDVFTTGASASAAAAALRVAGATEVWVLTLARANLN